MTQDPNTNLAVSGSSSSAAQAASSGNSDSFSQITVGPAALSQKLIYEIMEMYSEITGMEQQQKVSSLECQTLEAQGQAKATVDGGKALGQSLKWQAGFQIAGALTSAGVMMGGTYAAQKGLSGKLTEADTTMKPMEKADKLVSANEPEELKAGVEGLNANDEITQLAKEFKDGNFENIDSENAGAAISRMKTASSAELDPDSEFANFNFDDWKTGNQQQINRLATQKNSIMQEMSMKSQTVQTISSAVNGTASGAGSAAQGQGQEKKGEYDASASLNSTAAQQAGSTANDFGQAMSKAYEAQNAEVQILEKIHQTNSVRG